MPKKIEHSEADLYKPIHGGYPFFASQHSAAPPISYSINLMWVRKSLNLKNKFIAEDTEFEAIASSALSWMTGNPTARINIWYDGDSDKVSDTQVKDSVQHLKQRCLKEQGHDIDTLEFKDIHLIQWGKTYHSLFYRPLPFFCKIDLLKLYITREMMWRQYRDHYVVYTDIDVTPMSMKELFDQKTISQLNTSGLVFAQSSPFENCFHITKNLENFKKDIHPIEAFFWDVNLLLDKCHDFSQ